MKLTASCNGLPWQALMAAFALMARKAFGAKDPATLTQLWTVDSAWKVEHDQLTKCYGNLYYSVHSTKSDSSKDGIYRFDGEESMQVVASIGKVRGLMCHLDDLYYFKRVTGDTGSSWGFFRFKHGRADGNGEIYLGSADDLSHDPPTEYAEQLFIGAKGPKLYKLLADGEARQLGKVWEPDHEPKDDVFPIDLVVHKGEKNEDLYFVAPDNEGKHSSLWKFNVESDKATVLKDLVVRTGDPNPICTHLTSYKADREFSGNLYFTLGPFEDAQGRNRLAAWDGKAMPLINQVQHFDPTHLTVFQGKLYMSLRDPSDLTKFGLWEWNGKHSKKVAALPDDSYIHRVVVWEDDLLAIAGNSGPLVVYDGTTTSTVSITAEFTDVNSIIPYKGNLLVAGSKDQSDDNGNLMWILSKGVFQSSPSDANGGGGNGALPKGDGNEGKVTADEDSTPSGDGSSSLTKEKKDSKSGGKKFMIVFFVFGSLGVVGYFLYKKSLGVEKGQLASFWFNHGKPSNDSKGLYADTESGVTSSTANGELQKDHPETESLGQSSAYTINDEQDDYMYNVPKEEEGKGAGETTSEKVIV